MQSLVQSRICDSDLVKFHLSLHDHFSVCLSSVVNIEICPQKMSNNQLYIWSTQIHLQLPCPIENGPQSRFFVFCCAYCFRRRILCQNASCWPDSLIFTMLVQIPVLSIFSGRKCCETFKLSWSHHLFVY